MGRVGRIFLFLRKKTNSQGGFFFIREMRVRGSLFFWFFWFLTEEIQYHDGLRSRELGQAPILLCAPNS